MLHHQYKANTIKTRNMLSTFLLSSRILQKQASAFHQQDYQHA